jgi:hypothetical protein
MKKTSLIALIVFCCVGFANAQTTKTDPDIEKVSAFKLEYTQTGKYSEFQRLLTLGSGMVYEGSTRQALVLHDGDLKLDKYSFVTTDSLDVFEPSIQVGWYGNRKGDCQIEIKVYRNGVQIDKQNVVLKPENSGQVQAFKWSYKAD